MLGTVLLPAVVLEFGIDSSPQSPISLTSVPTPGVHLRKSYSQFTLTLTLSGKIFLKGVPVPW